MELDYLLGEKSFCSVHVDRPIESFCLYHYQPCCQKCIQNYHSDCEIQPMDDDVTPAKCQFLINNLIGKLEKTSSKIEEVVSGRKSHLEDLNSQQKEVEASVSKLREAITRHFDELEYKLHQEVLIAHTKCVRKIRSEIRDFEKKKDTLQEHKNVLELFKKKKSKGDNFNDLKEISTKQREFEDHVNTFLENLYCFNYNVKFRNEVSNLKSTVKSFGEIEIQSNPTPKLKYSEKVRETSSVSQPKLFNGSEGSSENNGQLERITEKQLRDCVAIETNYFSLIPEIPDPFITGGTFLDGFKLLLADMGNAKLYFVNDSGSLEDTISLHDDPFDVTMVTESTAAVTIPKQNLIQYIDVKNKIKGKQFRLKERPWGISFNGSHLVTICDHNIVALDTQGSFICKIDVTGDVEYLAASTDYVYYTAGNMPVVRCVNFDGKEIFKNVYKNLNRPAGISLDRQGHVYVVGGNSYNVHQLEPTGKLIKIIVPEIKNITKLRNIRFDPMGEKFFVTHDDAKIKCYKLEYPQE